MLTGVSRHLNETSLLDRLYLQLVDLFRVQDAYPLLVHEEGLLLYKSPSYARKLDTVLAQEEQLALHNRKSSLCAS